MCNWKTSSRQSRLKLHACVLKNFQILRKTRSITHQKQQEKLISFSHRHFIAYRPVWTFSGNKDKASLHWYDREQCAEINHKAGLVQPCKVSHQFQPCKPTSRCNLPPFPQRNDVGSARSQQCYRLDNQHHVRAYKGRTSKCSFLKCSWILFSCRCQKPHSIFLSFPNLTRYVQLHPLLLLPYHRPHFLRGALQRLPSTYSCAKFHPRDRSRVSRFSRLQTSMQAPVTFLNMFPDWLLSFSFKVATVRTIPWLRDKVLFHTHGVQRSPKFTSFFIERDALWQQVGY